MNTSHESFNTNNHNQETNDTTFLRRRLMAGAVAVSALLGTGYAAADHLLPERASTTQDTTSEKEIETVPFENLTVADVEALREAKAIIEAGADGVGQIPFTVESGETIIGAAAEAVKAHSHEDATFTPLQNEEMIITGQWLNEDNNHVTPAGFNGVVNVADFLRDDGVDDYIITAAHSSETESPTGN